MADFWCELCRRWTAPEIIVDEDDRIWAREDLGEATPDSVIDMVAERRARVRWAEQGGSPKCSTCGEPYTCGECGFEIDTQGACQRPPALGHCPDSVLT